MWVWRELVKSKKDRQTGTQTQEEDKEEGYIERPANWTQCNEPLNRALRETRVGRTSTPAQRSYPLPTSWLTDSDWLILVFTGAEKLALWLQLLAVRRQKKKRKELQQQNNCPSQRAKPKLLVSYRNASHRIVSYRQPSLISLQKKNQIERKKEKQFYWFCFLHSFLSSPLNCICKANINIAKSVRRQREKQLGNTACKLQTSLRHFPSEKKSISNGKAAYKTQLCLQRPLHRKKKQKTKRRALIKSVRKAKKRKTNRVQFQTELQLLLQKLL